MVVFSHGLRKYNSAGFLIIIFCTNLALTVTNTKNESSNLVQAFESYACTYIPVIHFYLYRIKWINVKKRDNPAESFAKYHACMKMLTNFVNASKFLKVLYHVSWILMNYESDDMKMKAKRGKV